MGLFPAYIENGIQSQTTKKQVIPKEYGMDFETGQLTGEIVEGLEAVKVWIWLALQIPRYRHYIYTWDYGNEFEDLMGRSYTKEYIESQARRMTEDCLFINENIRGISDFSADMEKDVLTISFTAETIYGDIDFKQHMIV